MKKTSLTLLAAFAAAFAILAPAALMADQSNPPDPWQPPVKDTTGRYETIYIDSIPWQRLVCPAPGEIHCTLLLLEPMPIIDMELLGWFDTDEYYYYFHAKNDEGTIVNDKDGTVIMAVPKEFLDE